MRGRLLAAALAAAFAATGCAGALRPTTGMACAADGRTRWARYDTPHVTFVSEHEEPLARELAAALEWSHQALRASAFKQLPPTRVEVLGLAYEKPGYAWSTLVNVGFLADVYTSAATVLGDEGPALVIRMRASDPRGNMGKPSGLTPQERTYAVHEVTHQLAFMAIPVQPPWLAEGLATYFEGARTEDGVVWVGIANQQILDLGVHAGRMPARRLLALRRCDLAGLDHEERAAIYVRGLLLVHRLATSRGDAFGDFLRRMVAGDDATAAWAAAFPDLAPERPGALEALDRDLDRYGRSTRFRAMGHPALGEPFEVRRTALSCTEARVARMAAFRALGMREALDRESAQLLAEVPGHPDALLARAELEPRARRLEPLRAAVRAGPGSSLGWALLAEVLPEGPEREAAVARAGELGAGDPRVEARLAEALLSSGRNAEALERAGRAVAAVPWSVRAQAARARALARAGVCGEARAALFRAETCFSDRCRDRVAVGEGAPEPLRGPYREQVSAARAEVEACAPATASPR